jgi:hypothetical protein
MKWIFVQYTNMVFHLKVTMSRKIQKINHPNTQDILLQRAEIKQSTLILKDNNLQKMSV